MYGSHEDVTCHNLTSHILTVYSSDLQNETYRRQKCDLSSPKLFVRIIYLSTVSQKLGENKSQHHLEITGLLKWSLKFRNLWFVCNFLLFLLTGLYVSFIVCWNFPFISKLNPHDNPFDPHSIGTENVHVFQDFQEQYFGIFDFIFGTACNWTFKIDITH